MPTKEMTKNEIKMDNEKKITCVFVHGWGMNSAVWDSCLQLLPSWMDVICLDLPGHGSMKDVQASSLDDYVRLLSSVSERPIVWIGWSLGGLAIMELAHFYPERVKAMFLVASNPCFVKHPDWSAAVEKEVFEQFSVALNDDMDATVKHFLALQVKGSKAGMSTVRELQRAINSRGHATSESLKLGLDILSSKDLRAEVSLLECPIKYYLGERDTLVPVVLAERIKKLNSLIDVEVASGAAHAPFVSHPEQFVESLVQFVKGLK